MSYAIDAANRLHTRQVEAATQMQDLLIKAVGGLAVLRDKAPQPSERLAAPLERFAGPLEKVTAPVAKVVGTREELAAYASQTRRDWTDLRTRWQDAIAELRVAEPESELVIVPEQPVVPEATFVAKPKPRAKTTAKATDA